MATVIQDARITIHSDDIQHLAEGRTVVCQVKRGHMDERGIGIYTVEKIRYLHNGREILAWADAYYNRTIGCCQWTKWRYVRGA